MYKILLFLLCALTLMSCVSVQENVSADKSILAVETEANSEVDSTYMGLKRKVAIARFTNETDYGKGAFYTRENDEMSKQALDILSTKLASSGKFILLERADADKINSEIENYTGVSSQKIGADFLIIGSITEFGRKTTGETSVFSRTKRQTVEAGVSIRIVDVSTGQIIYSEEGKGEAETEATTVLGFGGQAGFDATLTDKALSAAISKLVENIINNCMDRPWKSFFLSLDEKSPIIAGGPEQGIKQGDVFAVYEKGEVVVNPQTGIQIELPGNKVATIEVVSTQGTTSVDGYSIVKVIEGSIADLDINNLVVKEN